MAIRVDKVLSFAEIKWRSQNAREASNIPSSEGKRS